MAHTGRITKELREKLHKEIQDSIFERIMQAVRLAGDSSKKTENALKIITRCVIPLVIEEAETKHGVSLIPEQEPGLIGTVVCNKCKRSTQEG